MDKRTIKSLILKLRDEGNTFQEIADILKNEYDVKMSRQAVHGMYTRTAAKDINHNEDINMTLAINDIINYDTIGIKPNDIKHIIEKHYNISLSTVTIMEIPFNNEKYRKSIYRERLDKLRLLVKSSDDIGNIKSLLGYKGEPIRDTAFNQLLYDYILLEIKDRTVTILAKTYNLTNDKALVKDMAKKLNVDITCKDLEKIVTT